MDQKSDSSDQHSEAAWQHRAEMALASVIAADRLITYAELADAANIPPPHRIHKLTLWLETKLVADHQAGAKLHTARVISRRPASRPVLALPSSQTICRLKIVVVLVASSMEHAA